MPELPEVETIARQLDKAIVGKKITNIDVLSAKSFLGNHKQLYGTSIEKVDRHSKMVVWHLDSPKLVVLIHLKMTGQLVWRPRLDNSAETEYRGKQVVGGHPSGDWNAKLPNKHTRVVIYFSDGSILFFNDMRKFGWLKLLTGETFETLLSKLPPDVVDKEFTLTKFAQILASSRRPIKLVAMDQSKIGGMGNIYINDALNLAKVDPHRPSNGLKTAEIKQLYLAIKKVIDLGIKYGGATYSDYRDTRGQGGRYQDHFLVYDRESGKCLNCGGTITKATLGGRGTYWCPQCQV